MTDIKQETQTTEPTGGNQEQERTFTQTELDTIISERLRREREKYADYESIKEKAKKYDEAEEANKSELQKATERADALQAEIDKRNRADKIRGIRDKVAAEMKVPAALLSGETEEECKAQAQGILDFAKPAGYPQVRTAPAQVPAGSGNPRDDFAEYMTSVMGNRR